ncbi:hypothetical protein [Legionella hackeliae]|uniref:Uncharacterized protein n=1 Tax=Legionella hackeliae TaxID=449 RepID=A0A0A8UNS4_LEGHA|nr:hypothetical protein [Legionella hackeliae]KTD13814.1 hypothetical protein Lhac_0658 [Legionella hackeliae]CEK10515.1 protein of unknown function [Legionella hackeliae]STX47252.1 Uncharacterised protein [Legionella hackeliae]
MPISQGVDQLFKQLIKSYKNSNDENYSEIYPKLLAIHKEITQAPESYSDEQLIIRLTSSALISPKNEQFSQCLRNFLMLYEKKIASLDLLVSYENDNSVEFVAPLAEIPQPEPSITSSRFFKELEEAIRQRRLRMDKQEREKTIIYPFT